MTTKYNEILSLWNLLESIKNEWDCGEFVSNSSQVEEVFLDSPFDAHLHLRDGEMLKIVAPLSAKTFSWWVIMPNLTPAIESIEEVLSYKKRILEASNWEIFEPFMTLNFRPDYTKEMLLEAKSHIIWIKMYPKWQTTNSERWIDGSQIDSYRHTLEIMQELWIPLLVHGERVDWWDKIDELDKERKFWSIYEELAKSFPKLKIIMEHVSTKEVIELVDKYPNLYATVTLHHLLVIHNHIVWGWTKTHIMCMPIPKLWDDRKALLKTILNWNPKIMFGSDSAPHPKNKKESSCWCAWVFTAPIALQSLVEIFESFWKLDKLNDFLSWNAKKIYSINLPEKKIKLRKTWFLIPENYWNWENVVVPFLDGRKLAWEVVD